MLKILGLAGFAGAIGLAAPAASAEPLKVVASFSIIADLAQNVGGGRVEITTLVGPNGDAHVFEPRPFDLAAVASAQLVLVNGLQLEGFLPRLVEASGTQAPLVELAKGADLLKYATDNHEDGEPHDHEGGGGDEAHADEPGRRHGAFDPHAWQSVKNAEVYVANIAAAFCRADPAGCDAYEANAEAYRQQLLSLDAEITSVVGEIPTEKRTVITSHDAFGYFEHAYGLDFIAPEGVSTDAEASAADVAALIRQVRAEKASAIFVENITNTNLINQIAGETSLRVGGELYSDALSDGTGPAPTYIDMMRHNAETIRDAILGS